MSTASFRHANRFIPFRTRTGTAVAEAKDRSIGDTVSRLMKRADEVRLSVTPEKIRELALKKLSKEEIAKALGMSYRTFQFKIAESLSLNTALVDAMEEAGTFRDSLRSGRTVVKTLEADEGVVVLQKVDKRVLAALRSRRGPEGEEMPLRKRIRHLRDMTGLDTSSLVKSLERLTVNLKITVHEGVVFTEYEAD